MIHTDEAFSRRVEEAVARLEKQTDAEVIVVAAERSGSYTDVALAGGVLVAAITLVLVVAVPVHVHPVSVILDPILIGAFSTWLFSGRWWLRRIVPRARQLAQVGMHANAEFHREAVHGTPNRTGLLIYVSSLEGRVKLLPDVGIEAQIPKGEWATASQQFAHDDLDHFLAGLEAVGSLLAERVPHTGDSDAVNLPDAPRIR